MDIKKVTRQKLVELHRQLVDDSDVSNMKKEELFNKVVNHLYVPAFSNSVNTNDGGYEWENGMYLRDYFAGKAINGLLANSVNCNQGIQPTWLAKPEEQAKLAYEIADAMMKERYKSINV